MGDLLNFNLSAIYSKEYHTTKFRQRYVDIVLIRISIMYSNFILSKMKMKNVIGIYNISSLISVLNFVAMNTELLKSSLSN
jgi:hypothetical protein